MSKSYTDGKYYLGKVYEGRNYYSGNSYEVYIWDIKKQEMIKAWGKNPDGTMRSGTKDYKEWLRRYPECSYNLYKP